MKKWRDGDLEGAYQVWMAVLRQFPHDVFASKRAQLMGLLLGNEGYIYGASLVTWDELERDFAAATGGGTAAIAAHPGSRYIHGMHAFGLEQIGDWRRASDFAQEGMRLAEGSTETFFRLTTQCSGRRRLLVRLYFSHDGTDGVTLASWMRV